MERRKEEPRIVADTNILISALLKDHSVHARLIKSKFFSIYFPEYGLKEIEKYRSYIIAKRKKNSQYLSLEFSERYIMEEIKIAPFDLYCQKIKDASEIMKEIDEKDAPILALALQLCCPRLKENPTTKGFKNNWYFIFNYCMIIIHTTNELPPQRHRVHRERTETKKK